MSEDEMYDDFQDSGSDNDSEEDGFSDVDDQEQQDQDLDFDESGVHFKSTKMQRRRSFEVLEPRELKEEEDKLLHETMDVLGVQAPPIALVLLRHFKWNKEKLIERFMENPDKLSADAGIPDLKMERPAPGGLPVTCMICCEKYPQPDTYALSCGHRYCKDCWKSYIQIKVVEGPAVVDATCPFPKCKVKVHEDAVQKLVSAEMLQKYRAYILKSFVDDNPQIKWCPAPGCEYAMRVERKDRKEAVLCRCGFQYCFNCNDADIGDHMPCPCPQVDMWLQKASDESENVTWMLANTKKCPECRSPIEKNGGCMHMMCKKNSGGCGFEFCWLCRGPWSEHGSATGGYYNCNKYDKSNAKDDDEKAADAKTELEAYMFYYHRYESHRNAMKIADDQRRNCVKKEDEILAKFDVRSADTKFLMEATEQLLKNRRVLQYSYVYGYYLDKKSQERNLFEYLQEDLEKHTNHLSTLYETATDKLEDYQGFMRWKEQVTNYTRITKKFLDNFVEGVSRGLTSNE
eukprot:TRINITY_DN1459_c0_g1_i1.p1 TRINITY_DN1459_c0_g1~~TRINITY_DN1459_c0_g1_i1.p1  ORF type:complete len:516 (-),score=173.31 TRINITY_DN1459_c0_g1_i1:106-1653(-)